MTITYKELRAHLGHKIVCVGYALQDKASGARVGEFQNVAIECEDCMAVIVDVDKSGGWCDECGRKLPHGDDEACLLNNIKKCENCKFSPCSEHEQ